MTQAALNFDAPRAFDGSTFSAPLDGKRLSTQFERVRELMSDHAWRTLAEIQAAAGGTEASISARLRDLRKVRFGRHTVERRRRGDPRRGLHEYRLAEPGA